MTDKIRRPKHYSPEVGDEFIALKDLRLEHKHRVFEARNQKTGEGLLGRLEDANLYLLDDTVAIRFYGEPLGIFERPDALILMKPEGFRLPTDPPEGES